MKDDRLIFEMGAPGRRALRFPRCDVPEQSAADLFGEENLRQTELMLPECGENEVVRHFNRLSRLNHGLDTGYYPLGSCTMKYNPKAGEWAARLPGFAEMHPLQPEEDAEGALALIGELSEMLCRICGMAAFTTQPAAGAHGELTGLMLIKKYHESRGDFRRSVIIVPDSAHGTNPASAACCGLSVRVIKSGPDGLLDLDALKEALSDDVAGLMLTNPNTLGLFEKDILEASRMVHEAGGLLYYDGANLNAVLCKTTPAAMGFDVVHLNLHKTFGTPHGGGGPGAGPVGVGPALVPFLPAPVVVRQGKGWRLDYDRPESIGRVRSYYGNFGVLVKAYAYILMNGAEGLDAVSTAAVANANYLMRRLWDLFDLPYGKDGCMHEFVLSGERQHEKGVSTLDMAKGLIDAGVHPPTVYFPLIVKEAMMIEPTESETVETLEQFAVSLRDIARRAEEDPDSLHAAPVSAPVGRLDELTAARNPRLVYKKEG